MTDLPKKILIVEDDELITQMYQASLATSHFELRIEKDGGKGWEALQQYVPDLIILDMMMPKLNGIEVLTRVRADARLQHVPVVIMSSLMDEEDRKKALDLGANEYWIKRDVNMTSFEAEINRVLQTSVGSPTAWVRYLPFSATYFPLIN